MQAGTDASLLEWGRPCSGHKYGRYNFLITDKLAGVHYVERCCLRGRDRKTPLDEWDILVTVSTGSLYREKMAAFFLLRRRT